MISIPYWAQPVRRARLWNSVALSKCRFCGIRSDRCRGQGLSRQPNYLPALRVKLAAAAMAGRTEEMEDSLSRLRCVQRDISLPRLMRIHTSRPQAQRDAYEIALRKAGLS